MCVYIGLRELFRTRGSEGGAEGNENCHGQVQRQHADERAHAELGLVETGRGTDQRARVRYASSTTTTTTSQTPGRRGVQQGPAEHRHQQIATSHLGRIQQALGERPTII